MKFRRARPGDLDHGTICPSCAGPKTPQALRCSACYHLASRRPDYWERRTCACGAPKLERSPRCRRCYLAARALAPSRNTGRPQRADHPWRKTRVLTAP